MNILPWKHANDDVSTIKTTTTRCVEDTQEEKAVVVATAISGKTVITTKPQTPTSSSWMKSKDPRIVRVSRAFGGKDRHSKVCTLRGLRDRRVRLSVPTAIQLYDLQERLGVDQPSKAVDWLLDVAKNDIDELPPLPVSPETFSLFNHHQAFLNLGQRRPGQDPTMTQLGFKLNNGCLQEESACNTSKERGQNDVVFTNNHHVIGSYGSYNNMEHYHQQQQQQHLSFQGDYHQVQSFVPYPSQVLLCPMTTLASTTTTTTTTTSSTIQTLFPSSTNSSGAMESMDPRLMVSHFQMPLMGSSSQNTSTLYSLLQHGKSNNNNGSSGN